MTTQTGDRTDALQLRSLLRAPIDPWTYRSLAYVLLAFPLGIGYYVVLATGMSLTLGLSITLLGPVVAVATVQLVVVLAWVDGELTRLMLAADVDPVLPSTEGGSRRFLGHLHLGPDTWRGLLYLVWKVVLGFAGFVGLVTAVTLSTSLLLVPFAAGDHAFVFGHKAGSAAAATTAALGGIALGNLTLVLVLVNALGHASARIAERLLTSEG